MVIGACTLHLRIPANHSLKGKRQVLRSLTARVRKDFNVSNAEVDSQDSWQAATLGIVCVSGDSTYAHGLLMSVIQAVSSYRLDAEIEDFEIELL
jgi:uncharacterized protein YlxP (DUF503 family)